MRNQTEHEIPNEMETIANRLIQDTARVLTQ